MCVCVCVCVWLCVCVCVRTYVRSYVRTYACMCTHACHDENLMLFFGYMLHVCYDDCLLKGFYLLIDDNLVKMYGLQKKKKSL